MGKPRKSKAITLDLIPQHSEHMAEQELLDPMTHARAVLIVFLDAWVKRDYQLMTDNCNKTWFDSGHQMMTTLGWISMNLGMNHIKKYEIKGGWQESETTYCFNVRAVIDDMKCYMNINVLCESAPYCPNIENGIWGVNPISANQIKWEK